LKRLIFDLDHTLCVAEQKDYPNARPREDMIERLRSYREQGFAISIYTSRNVNDDRAIRPSEFLKYSREEIDRLLEHEK
jgi:hydroxymethylpyrimidine pyrophosphatase-like HAD family hydrolase